VCGNADHDNFMYSWLRMRGVKIEIPQPSPKLWNFGAVTGTLIRVMLHIYE